MFTPDALTPHAGEPPHEGAPIAAAARLGAAEAALALDEELTGTGLHPRPADVDAAGGGHRMSRLAAAQAVSAVTIMPGAYPGAAIIKARGILPMLAGARLDVRHQRSYRCYFFQSFSDESPTHKNMECHTGFITPCYHGDALIPRIVR